ncbi:hypothetical protein Ahy_A10g048820 [Arachis hypogaea]|uniref:Protein FAR1-RELATED SEQUENCE n=1 Tax=Arachis hypogaea TaxID=3818 RepID=A0A445B5Z0_ARAHY|nr:hypothetical protein Ahy_A10g048820 [Arachis hypogaea]
MYNEVRKQRELQGGDVNAAIRFLEGVASVDGRMFWRRTYAIFSRMIVIVRMIMLFFGDVLAIDATYEHNKYNLSVVVFPGVNHHNQNCVFTTTISLKSHIFEFYNSFSIAYKKNCQF